MTVQQNASPVMTHTFQPVIHIHPPVGAAVKNIPDHFHTSHTQKQFETVREHWRLISALKDAFWALPKAGGIIGRRPDDRESAEFIKRYDEAAQFLNTESPSIPRDIAEETSTLLKIALTEVLKAATYPDPFNGSVSALLGEAGWRDFVESRSVNLQNFNVGADKVHNMIRSFLEGQGEFHLQQT